MKEGAQRRIDQEIANLDLRLRNEFGFEPKTEYQATFFTEATDGGIVDHMVLISDADPQLVMGIFKLKRDKIKSLDEHIEFINKYLAEPEEQKKISQLKDPDADTHLASHTKHLFESKGIAQSQSSALFYKWHDGRIHTFILDELGGIAGVYRLDVDKISSTEEYFDRWTQIPGAFEDPEATEHYQDNNP